MVCKREESERMRVVVMHDHVYDPISCINMNVNRITRPVIQSKQATKVHRHSP